MYIDWSLPLRIPNPWENIMDGPMLYHQGDVYFFCANFTEILAFSGKRQALVGVYPAKGGLPRKWRFVDEEKPYVVLDKDWAIDLSTNKLISPLQENILNKYKQQLKPDLYYEEAPFTWQNYRIEHMGYWGYICKKDSEPIWKFSGQAYLYTDMLFSPGRVAFGTAGQGGYFYILDLETGVPVLRLKTGGTVYIERLGDSCFVLHNDKTAHMLRINIDSGEIIDRVPLPGVATAHSVIKLLEGKLYAITFQRSRDRLREVYWSQISY